VEAGTLGADNRGEMYPAVTGTIARGPLFGRLFAEGFALVRERSLAFGILALICAISAASAYRSVDLLQVFASGDPVAAMRTPPINAILLTTLIAIFFVLPSALRRIEPTFKMTLWRATITGATLICVGAATEVGYAAAVVPGIVVGVLLSQTLISALLRTSESSSARTALATIGNAARGSFELTRGHFMTTLGILMISLAMLGVPFFCGLVALVILDALNPASLVVAAPALFMTFVYCECMRYVLIVRWYQRLAAGTARAALAGAEAAAATERARTEGRRIA